MQTTRRLRTAIAVAVAATLVAVGAAAPASAALVYANNFDSAATLGAGVTATGLTNGSLGTATGSYGGSGGKSWASNFFFNASTGNPATASTLTLSNLGAHSHVSIDMMLGFLNSWDSSNGSVAPDYLDIYIDGNLAYKLTTIIASGSVNDHGGGTLVVDNGQIDGSQFFADDLVDMGTASFLTFAHTASTLTLTFQASGAGWQGGVDENWGVDSLSINTRGGGTVPEPGTWGLVAIAGLAAAAARRRRIAA
jgi:hypothetical protein